MAQHNFIHSISKQLNKLKANACPDSTQGVIEELTDQVFLDSLVSLSAKDRKKLESLLTKNLEKFDDGVRDQLRPLLSYMGLEESESDSDSARAPPVETDEQLFEMDGGPALEAQHVEELTNLLSLPFISLENLQRIAALFGMINRLSSPDETRILAGLHESILKIFNISKYSAYPPQNSNYFGDSQCRIDRLNPFCPGNLEARQDADFVCAVSGIRQILSHFQPIVDDLEALIMFKTKALCRLFDNLRASRFPWCAKEDFKALLSSLETTKFVILFYAHSLISPSTVGHLQIRRNFLMALANLIEYAGPLYRAPNEVDFTEFVRRQYFLTDEGDLMSEWLCANVDTMGTEILVFFEDELKNPVIQTKLNDLVSTNFPDFSFINYMRGEQGLQLERELMSLLPSHLRPPPSTFFHPEWIAKFFYTMGYVVHRQDEQLRVDKDVEWTPKNISTDMKSRNQQLSTPC